MSSYKLKLPWEQYQKLQTYADNVDTEIGGLGKVILEKGEFTITDVFLLEQEATSGECELSAEGVAVLYDELLDNDEDVDDIKMWWHSHGTMGVFFSKTDTDTMDEWPGDWIVAIVINKKKELKARFQVQKPIPMYMDLDVEIEYPVVVNIQALIDEIDLKVTKPVTAVTKYNGIPNYVAASTGWQPPERKVWNDPKHNHKSNANDYRSRYYGWDDPDDGLPTPLHRMTGSQYDQLMQEEYGETAIDVNVVEETAEEAEAFDKWFEQFQLVADKQDVVGQFELLEEAIRTGVLDQDDVQAYLTDSELAMFIQ